MLDGFGLLSLDAGPENDADARQKGGVFSSQSSSKVINAILFYENSQEKEFVSDILAEFDTDGNLKMEPLIQNLKMDCFPISESVIFYYGFSSKYYVHCGKDSNLKVNRIPINEIQDNGPLDPLTVMLKIRPMTAMSKQQNTIVNESQASEDLSAFEPQNLPKVLPKNGGGYPKTSVQEESSQCQQQEDSTSVYLRKYSDWDNEIEFDTELLDAPPPLINQASFGLDLENLKIQDHPKTEQFSIENQHSNDQPIDTSSYYQQGEDIGCQGSVSQEYTPTYGGENLEEESKQSTFNEEFDEQEGSEMGKSKRCRHPERTIRQVVQLIEKWKKSRYGDIDEKTGKPKRYTLDQAAEIVGVPRKSLDDYQLMLRQGEVYGYDFQKHFDKRFGLLRAYVKSCRKNNKNPNKGKAQKPEDGGVLKQMTGFDIFKRKWKKM